MLYNIKLYTIRIILIITPFFLNGQVDSLAKSQVKTVKYDSLNPILRSSYDTLSIPYGTVDSLGINQDSTIVPSQNQNNPSGKVEVSPDGLDIEVNYGARDTQWYEHKLKQMHLFGEAYVEYGSMKLNAGYIIFNLETNEAQAYSILDDQGHEVQKPKFKDGDQEFTYDRLRYNFDTNKGMVFQAVTAYTDLYILGAKTKFVGGKSEGSDGDDVIYNQDALITSCNHEEPHFGIRAKKLKVIPKKVGVTGPAQLELAGVPTPLWLPFGFFPLTEGRSTGLIFPRDFPYQPSLGFGVEGVGWYFPINDYMDLTLTGDFYTRGTWGSNAAFRYKRKYKYGGNVNINFRNNKTESLTDASISSATSFGVNITHNQDSKAHPYRNIGGSIAFSTNNHNARTTIEYDRTVRNQYTSNFYYKHSMPSLPFSFDAGLSHRQNTQTQIVDVTLPDIRLTMQTIQPFKRKKAVGGEQWYEKINVSGSTRVANFIKSTDATLFTRATLDDMKSGVRHNYSANTSLKLLKYFSVNPNVNYQEDWVFRTIDKQYFAEQDSTAEITLNGYNRYSNWNAGVDMNTALFGTFLSSKGWFRGIRHTVKPSVGYTIKPNTRDRYVDSIYYNNTYIESYTKFEGGPFGTPSFSEKSQSITYRITNVVEMKYWSRKHDEERKFLLLPNLSVNGSYDFEKDSLKWSTIRIEGNTNLIKNLTNLRFNFNLDPYLEEGNTPINTLVSTKQKIPVRLDRGEITLSSGINFKQLFAKGNAKKSETQVPPQQPQQQERPTDLNQGETPQNRAEKETAYSPPSLLDILGNFSIDHNLVYGISSKNNQDSLFVQVHTLGLKGSLPITENWNIQIGNIGYDIKNSAITYPYIQFSRKLHCWKMNFGWAPAREAFSFFVGVNSNTLEFLKYNYGGNNIPTGRF